MQKRIKAQFDCITGLLKEKPHTSSELFEKYQDLGLNGTYGNFLKHLYRLKKKGTIAPLYLRLSKRMKLVDVYVLQDLPIDIPNNYPCNQ